MRGLRAPALVSLALLAGPGVAGARVTLPDPVPCRGCWRPPLVTSWEWRLDRVPRPPYLDVDLYDIDGFDATAADVAALRSSRPGRRVTCYLSAGSWEDWRPDARRFPRSVIGRRLAGWPGERWLDIRRHRGRLGRLLRDRLDMCRRKGFDAVELDNVDGYQNRTGFRLTAGDQLRFNVWLANAAHRRGLSVALKNDVEQLRRLRPYFDWALNEECWRYRECLSRQTGGYGYDRWIAAGKAVMNVEYRLSPSRFCAQANAANLNSLRKRRALDGYRVACR